MEELLIVIAKRVCSLRRPPSAVGGSSALGKQLRVADPGRVHLAIGRNPVPKDVVEFALRDPATSGWFGEHGFLAVETVAPPPPVVPAIAGIPGVGVVLADGTLARSKSQPKRHEAQRREVHPAPPEPAPPAEPSPEPPPEAALAPEHDLDLEDLERLTRPSTAPETPKAKGGRK